MMSQYMDSESLTTVLDGTSNTPLLARNSMVIGSRWLGKDAMNDGKPLICRLVGWHKGLADASFAGIELQLNSCVSKIAGSSMNGLLPVVADGLQESKDGCRGRDMSS